MWQIHYIADYFVNLRSEEIFGMAIMEAVYYKSCVVAIKAPGPNTILESMDGHYLCDKFSEIPLIISKSQINDEYLSQGKTRLQSFFTWKGVYDTIMKVKR